MHYCEQHVEASYFWGDGRWNNYKSILLKQVFSKLRIIRRPWLGNIKETWGWALCTWIKAVTHQADSKELDGHVIMKIRRALCVSLLFACFSHFRLFLLFFRFAKLHSQSEWSISPIQHAQTTKELLMVVLLVPAVQNTCKNGVSISWQLTIDLVFHSLFPQEITKNTTATTKQCTRTLLNTLNDVFYSYLS